MSLSELEICTKSIYNCGTFVPFVVVGRRCRAAENISKALNASGSVWTLIKATEQQNAWFTIIHRFFPPHPSNSVCKWKLIKVWSIVNEHRLLSACNVLLCRQLTPLSRALQSTLRQTVSMRDCGHVGQPVLHRGGSTSWLQEWLFSVQKMKSRKEWSEIGSAP